MATVPFMRPAHKNKKQYLPPLFDRLSDAGTQLLDEEGVQDSIAREVSLILNTRFVFSSEDLTDDAGYPHPFLFGFQDFSSRIVEDRKAFIARVRQLITLYEPRMKNPDVPYLEMNTESQKIEMVLTGEMVLGEKRIKITFPVFVDKE